MRAPSGGRARSGSLRRCGRHTESSSSAMPPSKRCAGVGLEQDVAAHRIEPDRARTPYPPTPRWSTATWKGVGRPRRRAGPRRMLGSSLMDPVVDVAGQPQDAVARPSRPSTGQAARTRSRPRLVAGSMPTRLLPSPVNTQDGRVEVAIADQRARVRNCLHSRPTRDYDRVAMPHLEPADGCSWPRAGPRAGRQIALARGTMPSLEVADACRCGAIHGGLGSFPGSTTGQGWHVAGCSPRAALVGR